MTDASYDTAIWSDIVHLMPAWTWETDAELRLTYVHTQFEQLSGLNTADLMGHCIVDAPGVMHPEESGLDTYMEEIRKRRPINSLCYERILVTGERVVLMDSAVPKITAEGLFDGYRGISLNMTEALRRADDTESLIGGMAERTEALEESLSRGAAEQDAANRLFTGIVENMGEGLMVTSGTEASDPENRILMVNQAYRNLFQLSEEDVPPGMPMPDYIAMLAERGHLAEASEAFGEVNDKLARGEKVMMTLPSTGRSFYCRATLQPSGGYVLVHTDITELRTQNAELRAARDVAEVANKAKSTFLATMSHEIRTPMNGVVGMADLLAETELTEEQAECVDTIRSAALALTSLISDILDFSKVEAGRLELEEAPFDLFGLIDELFDLLQPLAEGKGVSLIKEVATDVPRKVEGDALRIRQVMLNLLGNAIKFTHEGRVSMTVGRREEFGNAVRFVIRDSGIGISEARLPHIFNPFEQVQTGNERRYEGSGLGLSISKKLVGAMQGEIAACSTLGEGSEFEVVLPLPAVANIAPPVTPKVSHNARLDGLRVLLVEDNRTNQMVVQKMLTRRGADTVVAQNGQEALMLFDPTRFDLVLMDLSMPVMGGLEATRKIRRRQSLEAWPHRPIIALTGNAFEKDKEDCRSAGMDGFLSKPIRRDELLLAITRQLATTETVAL